MSQKPLEELNGCTQSDFAAPLDCRLTQNGKRIFVHIFAWPFRHLRLAGLAGKVSYARFLHDGSEVPIDGSEWETTQLNVKPGELLLFLPVKKPPVLVPVIELSLE